MNRRAEIQKILAEVHTGGGDRKALEIAAYKYLIRVNRSRVVDEADLQEIAEVEAGKFCEQAS